MTTVTAAAPPKHPSSFSPSALRMHDECPRHYAYHYLEKPTVEEAASAHLIFGNAVHAALAFLFRLPVDKRNEPNAHRALRHYWLRQRRREEAFLTEEEEASWGLEALEALSTFCRERADELALRPLAVEEWVRAPLPGGRSVAGKVDRVDRIRLADLAAVDLQTGELPADPPTVEALRVTDYKTGRCRFEEGSELADDRGAQVYALAAWRTFRIPVAEVRFLFLRENQAVTWQVEREDLIELERSLARGIEKLVTAEEFEARPDFHCRWCPYRQLCPAAGGASLEELDADPGTAF